jgi:glycosyltransferase involved in cell wall biosynthesis
MPSTEHHEVATERSGAGGAADRVRLALVVSHPIQYYVPLYRRLAARADLEIRVFYTWHAGEQEAWDSGFQQKLAWDMPLREGYPYELVPNIARRPGSDHFWGLRNPELLGRVLKWQPDVVHLTGYAYWSHLRLLRSLARRNVPVLFRGDSHLLSPTPAWKSRLKHVLLSRIYRYPAGFLYVGKHNRDYYESFGVPPEKLWRSPHSIDTERFAQPAQVLEQQAREWRRELGIGDEQVVLLFAGKFQEKKQPIALMRAVQRLEMPSLVLVMIGDGEFRPEVERVAAENPARFRVLPFQNQSKMPVAYRLGDLFVLPSLFGETWGLAVNEALACGRPALVSDQVGCGPELIQPGVTGDVFGARDWDDFHRKLVLLTRNRSTLAEMGQAANKLSSEFSLACTEQTLMQAVWGVRKQPGGATAAHPKSC